MSGKSDFNNSRKRGGRISSGGEHFSVAVVEVISHSAYTEKAWKKGGMRMHERGLLPTALCVGQGQEVVGRRR